MVKKQLKDSMKIGRLRCEFRERPLGVDNRNPRFSWSMESHQRGMIILAWQILVAETPDNLRAEKNLAWDTGRVEGEPAPLVRYNGTPLRPRTRYFWRVRLWHKEGRDPVEGPISWWETGLLSPENWKAQWINACDQIGTDDQERPDRDFYKVHPAPLFRKEFSSPKNIKNARLYVSGLGYYEARLNGKRVGDHYLDPAWTEYGRRVYYSVYDVTEQLQAGELNCLAAVVGNGWYNPLPLRLWGVTNLREHLTVGQPRLIAQLEIETVEGESLIITTDDTWKTHDGPLLKNNIFLGEVYDGRLEIPGWDLPGLEDSDWKPAAMAPEPVGRLTAQIVQPIRIVDEITPLSVKEPAPGVFIVDMGENFAGGIRMQVEGPAGTSVKLRFGELVDGEGRVNTLTSACGQIKRSRMGGPGAPPVAEQSDTYILRGEKVEVYETRFTFHGYRYVEVTGYPGRPGVESFTGLRLRSDVPRAGDFECSNERFNKIQEVVLRTFQSNMMSVQSDCPHRERFGYGGDMVTTCKAFAYNYDMAAFYEKTVLDFDDSTQRNAGPVETAPFVGIADYGLERGHGPIGWSVAHPVLQNLLYRFEGNLELIRDQYENTRETVEYLRDRARRDTIPICIGDHESLDPKAIALNSTAFYYQHVLLLAYFAHLIGREDDCREYTELAQRIRNAFNTRFLENETGRYDIATQSCQAFALYYGLAPDEERDKVFGKLLEEINKQNGRPRAGIFGTRFMLSVLPKMKRNDLVYKMVDSSEYPGWGYMLDNGATTLWETWDFSDDVYSNNHPMFGSVVEWFFERVAGLRIRPAAVAADRIRVRPGLEGNVTWARAWHDTPRGRVSVEWTLEAELLKLEVELPCLASAQVSLPYGKAEEIMESGVPVEAAPGCTVRGNRDGWTELELLSGFYSFELPCDLSLVQEGGKKAVPKMANV